jgi:hypothetical protein
VEVVVKTHRRVRADIARWLGDLPGPPEDRRRFAAVHLEAMRDLLRQTAGRVPGAIHLPGIHPPTYWCQFVGRWWMQYCVRAQGGFLRRRRTVITILALSPEPDDAIRR